MSSTRWSYTEELFFYIKIYKQDATDGLSQLWGNNPQ